MRNEGPVCLEQEPAIGVDVAEKSLDDPLVTTDGDALPRCAARSSQRAQRRETVTLELGDRGRETLRKTRKKPARSSAGA